MVSDSLALLNVVHYSSRVEAGQQPQSAEKLQNTRVNFHPSIHPYTHRPELGFMGLSWGFEALSLNWGPGVPCQGFPCGCLSWIHGAYVRASVASSRPWLQLGPELGLLRTKLGPRSPEKKLQRLGPSGDIWREECLEIYPCVLQDS